MNMKLQLVPLPVSNPDASLLFYQDKVGFKLDHDVQPGNGMRVIQLTPPGSACSILFGTGMGDGSIAPGSVRNLHLVVEDIVVTSQDLIARGVTLSDINDMGGVKYAFFADPDGNSWALQQLPVKS